MQKISNYYLGILAVSMMLLIVSSPAAASTTLSTPVVSPDALDTSFSIEYLDVTAGIGDAALVSLIIYGGSGSYPAGVDPDADGFSQSLSWVLYGVNQADYATYLNRAPLQAPENLTLMLTYPSTMSLADAFAKAEVAKAAVESEYGTTMYLTLVNTVGNMRFVYVSDTDVLSALAADVEAFSSGGMDDLLTVSRITGAPVKAAGIGATTLGSGDKVAIHGALWVDPDAITTSGSDMTLSTMNIFGSDVNAASGYGLSRVRFNIPYPISPSSISPATSNPLPHVTGRMIWDLRHPVADFSLGNGASNYEVVYQVGMSTQFPMVENKLTINQTKLNQDGTLEFNYNLTNIGQAEAKNIDLSFPVGPDFQEIVSKNITMYRLKPGVTMDPNIDLKYNISLQYDTSGVDPTIKPTLEANLPELNYEFLTLDGWYTDGTNKLYLSTNTSTDLIDTVVTGTILGVAYSFGLKLVVSSADGIPTMTEAALNDIIVPALSDVDFTQGVSALSDVGSRVKENMPAVLKSTFNETRRLAYEGVRLFDFNEGDFTAVKRVVGDDDIEAREEWFLEATVPSLAAGDSQVMKWWVDNVPKDTDTFQTLSFSKGTTTDGYTNVTLHSRVESYADVMRYILAVADYSARPLSIYTGNEGSPLLGLDFEVPRFASIGMGFTWEDANGFKFFGLSNGQNLQVADNEAVLSTTVRFADNQQVFTVGDQVTIDVSVENSGDADATDVKVHLLHASLGRNWQFNRIDKFYTEDVGTIAAGDTTDFSVTVEANTFVGYHPVFAVVEFTSEAGETAAPVKDFFDLGVNEWRWAGETKQWSTSTLTGGLLLPAEAAARPAVPEPRITFSQAFTFGDGTFTFELTAKNDGDDDTTVVIIQTYDTTELELTSATSTKGTVSTTTSGADVGIITVSEVQLAPGESVTITMEFNVLTEDGFYIPPAAATFQISGESSLGDHARTGTEGGSGTSGGSLFALSASASAQEQSQASATESGEYTAYSGGAAVGAAAGVGVGGSTTDTVSNPPPAFAGFDLQMTFILMSIPLVLGGLRRKYKN